MSWVSQSTNNIAARLAFHFLKEAELNDYIPEAKHGKRGIAPESSVKNIISEKLTEHSGTDIAKIFRNYTFIRFCITPENHTPILLIESKGGTAMSLESMVYEPLIKLLRSFGEDADITKKSIGIENSTIIVSGNAAERVFEEAGVKHTLTWAAEKALSELRIKKHEGKQ